MKGQSLLEKATAQFDHLVQKGEIQYVHSDPIFVTEDEFTFEVRICPGLLDAKPRSKGLDKKYFADPDPDFHVLDVGDHHELILNKYCATRPQLLLCSKDHMPQLGYLGLQDLAATWKILTELDAPYVTMFSCGQHAGASVNHKHVQFMPYPKGFKLLPDALDDSAFLKTPFISFLGRDMPQGNYDGAGLELKGMYDGYVRRTKEILRYDEPVIVPHNLVMTKDWMFFIPRSKSSIGKAMTGAKGVVGMIWLYDEEELAAWTSLGFLNILAELGVPKPLGVA